MNYRDGVLIYGKRGFRVGEVVKHFKRETVDQNSLKYLYRIISIVRHSETKEKFVLYQSLENQEYYARPYKMFFSEVNKEKYPDIKQRFLFEAM